jgi:hypothetical protein
MNYQSIIVVLAISFFIVMIGLLFLYVTRKRFQNPTQTKLIRDVFTTSGTDPITGNKFTHTRTETSQERV